MTLKNLIHYAYKYCEECWLLDECDELSNLTASWDYVDLKDEPLENLRVEKRRNNNDAC